MNLHLTGDRGVWLARGSGFIVEPPSNASKRLESAWRSTTRFPLFQPPLLGGEHELTDPLAVAGRRPPGAFNPAQSCFTAYQDATTPAGAVPTMFPWLSVAGCGMTRTTVPTMAVFCCTPSGHSGTR